MLAKEGHLEVRSAALDALAAGRRVLGVEQLRKEAGQPIAADIEPRSEPKSDPPRSIDPEALREALAAEGGNLSRAATRLGVPRTTLRRMLERHGIEVKAAQKE